VVDFPENNGQVVVPRSY